MVLERFHCRASVKEKCVLSLCPQKRSPSLCQRDQMDDCLFLSDETLLHFHGRRCRPAWWSVSELVHQFVSNGNISTTIPLMKSMNSRILFFLQTFMVLRG